MGAALGDQNGWPHPDHMAVSEVVLEQIASSKIQRAIMWLDVPYVFMGHCKANISYAEFCQQKLDIRMAQIHERYPNLTFNKVVLTLSIDTLLKQIQALFTYNTQIWDSALFADSFPPCGNGVTRDVILKEYLRYSKEFSKCNGSQYCTTVFEVKRTGATFMV